MPKYIIIIEAVVIIILLTLLFLNSRKIEKLEFVVLENHQTIAKLEVQIEQQNSQILQFKADSETAQLTYEKNIRAINAKYQNKISKEVNNKYNYTCEETLKKIYEEQMQFIQKE